LKKSDYAIAGTGSGYWFDWIRLGTFANNRLVGDALVAVIKDDGTTVLNNDLLIGNLGGDELYGDAIILAYDPTGDGDASLTFGDDTLIDYHQVIWGGNTFYGDASEVSISVTDSNIDDAVISFGNDRLVSGGKFVTYYSYGDGYDLYAYFAGNSGEARVETGDDYIRGGYYIVGDFEYASVMGDQGSKPVVVFGNDVIIGTAETEVIYGDVYLVATDADTKLVFGSDVIIGGAGDNTLIGDYDWYTSITSFIYPEGQVVYGYDTFVFSGDFGDDLVWDFGSGQDVLRFEGFGRLGFDDLDISVVNKSVGFSDFDSVVISLEAYGGGTVTLLDVAELTAADVVFA